MPVSPGASGTQPRDPCRPWRGTVASGHKPRGGLLALQSLERNPQLSFATRMEDWTCLGQHKRQPEFPVVARESRRNSRKTTWLPRHRKMKPFPATCRCWCTGNKVHIDSAEFVCQSRRHPLGGRDVHGRRVNDVDDNADEKLLLGIEREEHIDEDLWIDANRLARGGCECGYIRHQARA